MVVNLGILGKTGEDKEPEELEIGGLGTEKIKSKLPVPVCDM